MELPSAITGSIDALLEFIYSFGPVCEKTVVLVPDVLTAQVAGVADAAGMDIETVSYVLGMFMCYPLGMIMAQIPFGLPRHIFSFLLGAFLLQFTLGVQWIHHLISSLVAYGLILALPRKTLKTALPIFAMAYMTLGHLHRQYINYLGWDLDFTGTQMVLTQKLYMIGYNLYDGELLAKDKPDRAAKKCSPFALTSAPSLIEFLGYTFCFANLLAGPATEYATYAKAIDGSVFKTPDGKMKIPNNVMATLKPFLTCLVTLGIHLTLSAKFPILDPNDPQNSTPYILTEEFLKKPFLNRFFHAWMGLFALREKYYFGWKNAEGAQNIWYAGFDGYDENGAEKGWETSNNIDIVTFETAPDVSIMSRSWNKKTSLWLSKYVYMRTGGSLAAVYSMSAFWHGFYPGYYIFFLSVPIPSFCDRLAKKKISPYFSKAPYSPYGILAILATTITINYLILPFTILAGGWSFDAYKSFYYFGHIGCVAYYIILNILPSPKKEKPKAE
mmetsp:Transcript_11181/g.32286  ORF Transcript_11181/g.32286 Transcript_11181/m.32286 type:complete len:500 (-) Transcript_11181:1675-3174(-)|eukprot:CAMPEP_0172368586 /NCGR_PEP_ID=MMETSP1060-20121228/28081_1 /TAXON_ID=37318 /ORGANISM="Pseudo-nitzschia pungens, Strain cf. cingulata" /LENGTH=499 /DNA_ID=CAMNT_0013093227 /DNA_START=56 /DNA_END=1555 /DNA_ORIENTATION=-